MHVEAWDVHGEILLFSSLSGFMMSGNEIDSPKLTVINFNLLESSFQFLPYEHLLKSMPLTRHLFSTQATPRNMEGRTN